MPEHCYYKFYLARKRPNDWHNPRALGSPPTLGSKKMFGTPPPLGARSASGSINPAALRPAFPHLRNLQRPDRPLPEFSRLQVLFPQRLPKARPELRLVRLVEPEVQSGSRSQVISTLAAARPTPIRILRLTAGNELAGVPILVWRTRCISEARRH